MENNDQQETAAPIEELEKAKEPKKKMGKRKAKIEDSDVSPKPSKSQKTTSTIGAKHCTLFATIKTSTESKILKPLKVLIL